MIMMMMMRRRCSYVVLRYRNAMRTMLPVVSTPIVSIETMVQMKAVA